MMIRVSMLVSSILRHCHRGSCRKLHRQALRWETTVQTASQAFSICFSRVSTWHTSCKGHADERLRDVRQTGPGLFGTVWQCLARQMVSSSLQSISLSLCF